MKVIIGSDHGGYELKEQLKGFLLKEGTEVKDYGTYSTDSVDYPDIALLVAEAVAREANDGVKGIIIDGAGVASAICANKVKGIRAVCCDNNFTTRNSREHNDANVLTLGARVIGKGVAEEIVKLFLCTPFAGGRHGRRVEKMMQIEAKYYKK
ncbi:MAG: ribose 5-phosphate isomerase B [Candidatus Eremiobacteraeota bacterium]|nr:ribose 5-phosphate isomerase B [Candidatus Eremiobacteraeota bacterium]